MTKQIISEQGVTSTSPRRSRADWERLVQAHHRSGLTQAAFCKSQGINPNSLWQWRKRLGVQPSPPSQGLAAPGFVQVAGPAAVSCSDTDSTAGVMFRLELGHGVVVTLRCPG